MYLLFTTVVLVRLILTTHAASQFDNSVLGQPTIYCEREQIRVEVETERPFTGRIYVKGEFRNKNCVRSYTDGRVKIEEEPFPSSEHNSGRFVQSRPKPTSQNGEWDNILLSDRHGSPSQPRDPVKGDHVIENSLTPEQLGLGISNEVHKSGSSNSPSTSKSVPSFGSLRIENRMLTKPVTTNQKGPHHTDESDNDLLHKGEHGASVADRGSQSQWILGSQSTTPSPATVRPSGNFPIKLPENSLTTAFGGSFAPKSNENEPSPQLKLYPNKGGQSAKTFSSGVEMPYSEAQSLNTQRCKLVCEPCECGREERHRRDNRHRVELAVPLGSCNAKRDRTITPPSLVTSFIVHVSFHDSFVTKYDRAYNVKCKYVESTIPLTTQINVTMSQSQKISGEVAAPKCSYVVSTSDGNSVTNVRVGDLVRHTWKCETEAKDVYSMLVHSCFVEDGSGESFQIIDEYGCTADETILGTPEYSADGLTATRDAFTFKYPDKSSLDFQCSFKTCTEDDKHCGAPPDCSAAKRRTRRSSDFFDQSQTIHSNSLNVLDVDNDALTQLPPSLSASELCLSVVGFGLLVSFLTFLLTTSMASAVALYFYKKFKAQQ